MGAENKDTDSTKPKEEADPSFLPLALDRGAPRCPYCFNALRIGILIQGMHSAEGEKCYGEIKLVHCKNCGHIIRNLFDPSHLDCRLETHEYAPAQLMI